MKVRPIQGKEGRFHNGLRSDSSGQEQEEKILYFKNEFNPNLLIQERQRRRREAEMGQYRFLLRF